MIFNFFKKAFGPEAGRNALRVSYDEHYKLALSGGRNPIICGLYGALCSRYRLRGKFVSELVHMLEIAPFAMMDQQDGKECHQRSHRRILTRLLIASKR
jgi:hypothetical protein